MIVLQSRNRSVLEKQQAGCGGGRWGWCGRCCSTCSCCGISEGIGTSCLSYCTGLPFPATEKDKPEHWLTVLIILWQSCSGHTMEKTMNTSEAVSQPMLWFLPELENAFRWCWWPSAVWLSPVFLLLCGVLIPGPRLHLLECSVFPRCRLQLQAPGPWWGLQRALHSCFPQTFGQVFLKDTVISPEEQSH